MNSKTLRRVAELMDAIKAMHDEADEFDHVVSYHQVIRLDDGCRDDEFGIQVFECGSVWLVGKDRMKELEKDTDGPDPIGD